MGHLEGNFTPVIYIDAKFVKVKSMALFVLSDIQNRYKIVMYETEELSTVLSTYNFLRSKNG